MTRRSLRRSIALVALTALAASCAPRLAVPPRPDFGGVRERFRARLLERLDRGSAVNAGVVMWIEGRGERLPGAQGDLVMAAPDRVRLRIASMFGTALDLGMRGDSLLAWVPSWKTGLRLGSASESLGVREAGGLVFRALSGNWVPPAAAWEGMALRDSVALLSWAEEGDSLRLALGRDGLPRWVRVSGAEATTVEIRYHAWDRGSGAAWPSRVELVDERHAVRLQLKTSQLRFSPHADTTRLAVRIPPHAEVLTLAQLRTVLDRLGVH